MEKPVIGLVVIIAILLIGISIFRPGDKGTVTSGTTTLQGRFVCLPHKNPGEVQTLECAFGLRTDSGVHYALDLSALPTSSFDLPMDRPFRVTGLVVPIEAISSDVWMRYDIRGIMHVESYEEVSSGLDQEDR